MMSAGRLRCRREGLTRICTDGTDQEQATATAGSSTALLTNAMSNFAQDDWVGVAGGTSDVFGVYEFREHAALIDMS